MQNKQRFVADQRWDLPHYNSMLQFIEEEFSAYAKLFITPQKHIVKNWLIENAGGLDIKVNNSTESVLFNTERDGKEDLYRRFTTDPLLELTLPDNAVNYVEVQTFERTCAPDTVALWDTTANSGSGSEYTQTVNIITNQNFQLVSNTVAFTGDDDKVSLAIVTTAGGVITNVQDERSFFFHLDSDYNFGSPRTDKDIPDLKTMYDAITTIIKEVKGSTDWYENFTGGLSSFGLLERLNYMLTDGGNLGWEVSVADRLEWSAALKIVVPNRAFNYTIDAQIINNFLDDEVIYVTLPDVGSAPSGSLTVNKVSNASYVIDGDNSRNFILAYRSGTKIYFGNGWQSVELESTESNQLGDGITQAWITATGLTDETDSTPPYTSTYIVTPGTSFTNAISELDDAVNTLFGLVLGIVYNESTIVPSGGYVATTQVTLPIGRSYELGLNQLEVYYDGIFKESGAGNDFLEVDDGGGIGTKIELLYFVPEDVKITFRIQIGGSGGGSGGGADIYDEGGLISVAPTKINYTGGGVTATLIAPNEVEISIPAVAGVSVVKKSYKNETGVTISANRVVSFRDDGTLEPADANVVGISDLCGITLSAINNNTFGDVIKIGNVAGILTGLGATNGQWVYMGETPGSVQLIAPSGGSDTIIALGRAEPPDGVKSAATDLFLKPEVISEP